MISVSHIVAYCSPVEYSIETKTMGSLRYVDRMILLLTALKGIDRGIWTPLVEPTAEYSVVAISRCCGPKTQRSHCCFDRWCCEG